MQFQMFKRGKVYRQCDYYLVNVNLKIFSVIITSQGHNFYKLKYISLEEVKIVPFQHKFLSDATESNLFKLYLKLFRPRSNCKPSTI